jgi:hypothetical protein
MPCSKNLRGDGYVSLKPLGNDSAQPRRDYQYTSQNLPKATVKLNPPTRPIHSAQENQPIRTLDSTQHLPIPTRLTDAQVIASWHPWEKKVSFYCPACDKKLSSKNPVLPKDSTCPKCSQNYTITHATYPLWKVVGFGLLTLFMSVLNIPRFIVFVILAMVVTPFLFTGSKRRFKLPTLPYLVGTLVAAGWIVTVPCGILLHLADKKVQEYQKELQRKQFHESIQRIPERY